MAIGPTEVIPDSLESNMRVSRFFRDSRELRSLTLLHKAPSSANFSRRIAYANFTMQVDKFSLLHS